MPRHLLRNLFSHFLPAFVKHMLRRNWQRLSAFGGRAHHYHLAAGHKLYGYKAALSSMVIDEMLYTERPQWVLAQKSLLRPVPSSDLPAYFPTPIFRVPETLAVALSPVA
jgi:hypothetical protein